MDNQATLDLVFEAMQGYLHASAFKAAIDIDLFTAIARGKTTCRDIAMSSDASERGVQALANLMVTRQFLSKNGEHYALSPRPQCI
ncbi:methyltransferase family protein [Novosphingobium sp.]|uniref:methyltransferase family protein n=1 Tax=Novosphingobium sp. TaxID=1874826 RepID=UPI003D0DEA1B